MVSSFKWYLGINILLDTGNTICRRYKIATVWCPVGKRRVFILRIKWNQCWKNAEVYNFKSVQIVVPIGARFSESVQTGPAFHPASYTMGAGFFPGVKQPGRGVDHPPPSSTEVKERIQLYIYSPSGSSWPVLGWTWTFLLQIVVTSRAREFLIFPSNMVYPALLPLMLTPRLPVVDRTDAHADLNGLVRFAERRNLVSVRVPSHFNWPIAGYRPLWTAYYSCRNRFPRDDSNRLPVLAAWHSRKAKASKRCLMSLYFLPRKITSKLSMTLHDVLPSYFHALTPPTGVLPYGCAIFYLTLYAELFHFHLASHRRCILSQL